MSNELQHAVTTFWRTTSNELSSALGQSAELSSAPYSSANVIYERALPLEWAEPEYRRATLESTIENLVAWQIRVNREERGMTQADLARAMGTGQSAISKLEDPEGGDVMVSTLVKAAHAFDCALLVKFVDFEEFATATDDVRPDQLFACPFSSGIQVLGCAPAPTTKRVSRRGNP